MLADSILHQTRLPDEVVVVDSGTKTTLEPVLAALAASVQKFEYIVSEPGLTLQRNRGVAASTGDILQFFDDDVVLESTYLEAIECIYTAHLARRVYAAQGRVTNLARDDCGLADWRRSGLGAHFSQAARTIFMLPDRGDGRVKLSGCPSLVNWSDEAKFVETLSGCCFSFRREVFTRVAFDESLSGYCSGEDLDMARQLLAWGMSAYYCPDARLTHRDLGRDQYDGFESARSAFRNRARFLRKHSSRRTMDRLAFWWSTVGYIFLEIGQGCPSRARGTVAGIRDEISAAISANPVCHVQSASPYAVKAGATAPRPRSEVVVCTRNRFRDMERFFEMYGSVEDAPPLLVVDASDDDETERLAAALSTDGRLPSLRYFRSEPGLTSQRMHAVSVLSPDTEVVHFLDDDTVVAPDYFERMGDCFAGDEGVLGACGYISNLPPHVSCWASRLFLIAGSRAGEVLPSGVHMRHFDVGGKSVAGDSPMEWLPGCCMSFRRSVFRRVSFDTRMEAYCLGEDLDFSFRVGLLGRLVGVHAARLEHLCSTENRSDPYSFERQALIFRYRWVSEMRGQGLRLSAFWWSCVGLALIRLVALLIRKPHSGARARHYVATLLEIWKTGRVPRNDRIRTMDSTWS